MLKKIALYLMVFFVLLLAGCSSSVTTETVSGYADDEIVISGLTAEDFTVTVADLAALETVEQKASATRANGAQVQIDAVGPLLDTFLSQYGKKQTDFTQVRFTATDAYSIAVSSDVLSQREIILALSDGGEPLTDEDTPVRVVIPGERAMYWVRHLCRIDFENDASASTCQKIVFLEAAAGLLPSSDYDYYGETDRVVAVRDLLDTYASGNTDETKVRLVASDGLEKSETYANLLRGQIKYTGKDSPRFVSDELPEGMQIYGLVWIRYGGSAFVSLPLLIEQSGQNGALLFSDLVRGAGMESAEAYRFVASDNTTVTLSLEDLADANLSIDPDGKVTLAYGSDGKKISDLLSIEAANS